MVEYKVTTEKKPQTFQERLELSWCYIKEKVKGGNEEGRISTIWPSSRYDTRTPRILSHNHRCMKCKRVFKIDCKCMYWAWLVACHYHHVSGINFSENYSPVVNNITLSILLLIMNKFGFSDKFVDIETAFFYGRLEELIQWNVLLVWRT